LPRSPRDSRSRREAMSKCVQCGTAFSSMPTADHFREYRCGACGGLVGGRCSKTSHNAKGEKVVVCLRCDEAGRAETAAADSVVGRNLQQPAQELLATFDEKLQDARKDIVEQVDARILDLRQWSDRTMEGLDARVHALASDASKQVRR